MNKLFPETSQDLAQLMQMKITKGTTPNKYRPHQGKNEIERRKNQMQKGMLKAA